MDADRRSIYLQSLERPEQGILKEIEKEAVESRVPILRRETRSILRVLLKIHRPVHVLEIGTAIGFSAILIGQSIPTNGHVTTIENFDKRASIARGNFERAGMESRITLMEGDALEILRKLSGPFDLVFLDAAKAQYIRYLPEIVRMLPTGGVLVADNVLQGGDILESRFAVERRDRTIHSRMRAFLYQIKHDEQLESSILPIGDGIAVSVRK